MFMRDFLGITIASASVLASAVLDSTETDVDLNPKHSDSDSWKVEYDHKHHDYHDDHGYHNKFDIFASPEGDGLGGTLKTFTINITESRKSLTNGSSRFHYEINDQVYGTPIIIDEGDEVEFIIDNYSFTETTIHLHGLLQQLSPWADGVPGVTQSVIPQNKRFIYRTRIMDQHGLYWAHSHLRETYSDGIVFPFYVRPAPDRPKPFSLLTNDSQEISTLEALNDDPVIITLSDYTVMPSNERKVSEFNWAFGFLCYDAIIINNIGRQNCPGSDFLRSLTLSNTTTDKGCLNPNVVTNSTTNFDDDIWFTCNETDTAPPVFEFDYENGWGVIHFLNHADHWDMIISIDEHEVFTFAADGNFHEPLVNDAFILGVSNRMGIAFRLDKPGEYVMRVAAYQDPQIITGYAIIKYGLDQVETTSYTQQPGLPALPDSIPFIDYAGNAVSNDTRIMDNLALRSWPNSLVPKAYEDADVLLRLDLNASGTLFWSIGEQFYDPLLETSQPPVLIHPEYYLGLNKSIAEYPKESVVDIVHVTAPGSPRHPLHKHFEHVWVLGGGVGPFNYSSITEAESAGLPIVWDSPPIRDGWLTFAAPPNDTAWFVVRYKGETSAAVLLHCHILAHQNGGMAYTLAQGPEDFSKVPEYYKLRANGEAPHTPLPFGPDDLTIPVLEEGLLP
ncbi:Cupredoxin [Wallemia mellicola]|uniref:Cupredoxin n=1 Tax=Wallemia mellicola TaxID=1708541 RepID=A0A4V4MMI1_9BASI|nr:Cupredoxin [Wallemia mellicola]TIB92381.1 Cupredoxin [Wallemia mellicola]TIC03503.1 Cupredoxin [Wallemia mellicola]TIC20054.1 Cupredoxin [Wallemia mellicola]TIC33016.1 Cupredoxin [Wallemia mellicola]